MREHLSRFERAVDSIEKFLEMENSPSIILSLYKSDRIRLVKRYPNLSFMPLEAVHEPKKPHRYLIQK